MKLRRRRVSLRKLWMLGRCCTNTGHAGGSGTSISLWTIFGSTLGRRLPSTLHGWVSAVREMCYRGYIHVQGPTWDDANFQGSTQDGYCQLHWLASWCSCMVCVPCTPTSWLQRCVTVGESSTCVHSVTLMWAATSGTWARCAAMHSLHICSITQAQYSMLCSCPSGVSVKHKCKLNVHMLFNNAVSAAWCGNELSESEKMETKSHLEKSEYHLANILIGLPPATFWIEGIFCIAQNCTLLLWGQVFSRVVTSAAIYCAPLHWKKQVFQCIKTWNT